MLYFLPLFISLLFHTVSGTITNRQVQFPESVQVITIRDLIFFDYDRRVPPPSVGPTNISVGLIPLYIQEISESEGHFTVLCGIDLYWTDKRLSWNPNDFQGQESILLEFGEIWVDLALASQNYSDIKKHAITPPDWNLTEIHCRTFHYPSMNEVRPQVYAAVYCFMQINRDPSYVITNFCVPCYIVTMLAVLAIHSAESAIGPRTVKYELGLVSLMSVSVLTLALTHTLPKSGTISRLHIFYYGMMGTIFTSGFISWISVVLERHYKAKGASYEKRKWSLMMIDGASALAHMIFLGSLMLWFLYLM